MNSYKVDSMLIQLRVPAWKIVQCELGFSLSYISLYIYTSLHVFRIESCIKILKDDIPSLCN